MSDEQVTQAPPALAAPSEPVPAADTAPAPAPEPAEAEPAPVPMVDPGLMGTAYRSLPDELIHTTEASTKLHTTERPERSP